MANNDNTVSLLSWLSEDIFQKILMYLNSYERGTKVFVKRWYEVGHASPLYSEFSSDGSDTEFLVDCEHSLNADKMVWWLQEAQFEMHRKRFRSYAKAYKVMKRMIKEANDILERQAHQRSLKNFLFAYLFNHYSDVGRKILAFVPGLKGNCFCLRTATMAGHMYLVEHFRRKIPNWPVGEMSDVKGRAYGYSPPYPVENYAMDVMRDAIKAGQLHVLQWIHCYHWNCGELEANIAALFNRLEILQWMQGFGVEMTIQGYNWALDRGHTDILIFYHAYKFQ